jgi:hypothetical protein
MSPCSQRGQRRRRLLADDRSNQPNDDRWPQDAQPARRWDFSRDSSSFLEDQLRCLDLVPRRWATLILLLLIAAAAIIGLEFAYFEFSRRAAATGATVATALNVAAKGSLACWCSSLMLLAAAVAALLVYSVRRHRADDYEGRYRIWLWVAACWLFAATDQAASLREAFRDAIVALSGPRLLGDGSLWWVVLYLVVLGAIGARLLPDMRGGRLSIATLLAAALAHVVAVVSRLGWIGLSTGTREIILQSASEMAGNLLVLAAMGFHARWIILDAERELSGDAQEGERPDTPTEPTRASASSAVERSMRVDQQHASPQPVCPRVPTPASTPAIPSRSSPAAPIPTVARKLTKDERKALKARLLREGQQRERQG